METELKQIETLSLRDYIDKEMTKLHKETLELFSDTPDTPMDAVNNMTVIMNRSSKLVALQEIAYRLEYGFIVEMGDTSLKHHLGQPTS